MYKKIAAMSIVAMIALVLVLPTITQAAGPGGRNHDPAGDTYGTASNFVDEDGDGVCDDCQGTGVGFVDVDGDGICDSCLEAGVGFIDEDGDGICDNMGIDGQQVKTSQSRNSNR